MPDTPTVAPPPPLRSTRTFTQRLRERIDKFLARHPEISPTAFGLKAINDPALYGRIRRGRPINSSTIDEIDHLIRTYRTPRSKGKSAPSSNKPGPARAKPIGREGR